MSTSLLELNLTSSSGEIVLSTAVPVQDLTLKAYRVEFSSTTSQPAVLYVSLPFINASSTVNDHFKAGLPILCAGALVTVQQSDITIGTSAAISERFRYSVSVSDGVMTYFTRLTLIFEYSNGQIF